MDEMKREFVLFYTRQVYMTALAQEIAQLKEPIKDVYGFIAEKIENYYESQKNYALKESPNGFGSSVSDTEVNNTVSVNESVDVLS